MPGALMSGSQGPVNTLTVSGASGNTLVVDSPTLVVDATNHRVGIGTASPAANRLHVDLTESPPSVNVGVRITSSVTLTGNYAGSTWGAYSAPGLNLAGFNATGTMGVNGYQAALTVSGSGTATGVSGFNAGVTNSGAGTITNAYGFLCNSFGNSGGGTITNVYGFAVNSFLNVGTNNYGFYGDIGAATGRWNFYGSGSAQNYFLGNVGIGSGKTIPAVALDVAGAISSTGVMTPIQATAVTAGGALAITLGSSAPGITVGSGAPTMSAAKGSIYLRSDGSGITDRLYVNTNGTTGWTNVVTAA